MSTLSSSNLASMDQSYAKSCCPGPDATNVHNFTGLLWRICTVLDNILSTSSQARSKLKRGGSFNQSYSSTLGNLSPGEGIATLGRN